MHQHTAKYAVSHCQICCIWGSVCIIGSVWSAFGAVGFGTSKHQIFMKRPYLYSKGTFWGSTSRPHIGHLVRTLFLLWGPPIMTGDGPKITYFGPKLAKHVKLVIVPKWSKRDLSGQPKCFLPFGTLLADLDPFGTFQTKMIFLPQIEKEGFGRGALQQKINFCLKWSKRIKMGPKGFRVIKNTCLSCLIV